MKMNNRFIYGILSLILAAIVAFIAIPAVTSKTSHTTQIVRMKSDVARGSIVTSGDVELVEVGGYNLPDGLAKEISDVTGTYATTNLYAGDYLLPTKLSKDPLSSDLTLNHIPDGYVAISITTQTLASALSDKLQANDIIRLFHYDKEDVMEPVADIPELRYVKVLGVTDSEGLPIDYTTPPAEDEERQQTATITVLATPLISRGNEALAEDLLGRQGDILVTLYGDGTTEEELTSSLTPETPAVAPDAEETTGATEEQPVAAE